MIQEIAQLIEDGTALTIGTDLFVGHLPLKTAAPAKTKPPKKYVAILENTPAATDYQWRDYQQKEIQILNADVSYFTARAQADALFDLLHGQAGVELPVLTSGELWIANSIEAVGSPAPIETPNADGLFVFSTNYIFRMTRLD